VGFVLIGQIQLDYVRRHRGSNTSLRHSHSIRSVGIVDLKELQRAHAVICEHQRWIQRDNILKRIGLLRLLWEAAVTLNVNANIEIWIQFYDAAFYLVCESRLLAIKGCLAEYVLDVFKYLLLVFYIFIFSGIRAWDDFLLQDADVNCTVWHHPHQRDLVNVMRLQGHGNKRVRTFL
jgi:hypothetical protein